MNGLLIINLLLVLIALFGLTVLYRRQKRLTELKQAYEERNQELIEYMEAFLFELKEENETFIREFTELIENHPGAEESKLPAKPDEQLVSGAVVDHLSGEEEREEAEADSPEVVGIPNQSLHEHQQDVAEIATYLQKGYSPVEIAKTLNRGKTEIELLIKFTPALMNIYTKNVQE